MGQVHSQKKAMTSIRQATLLCGLVLAIAASGCTPATDTTQGTASSDSQPQETVVSEKPDAVESDATTAIAEDSTATENNTTTTAVEDSTIPAEEDAVSTPVKAANNTTNNVANNSAQPASMQVTDAGIGSLTASTPFSADAIQSAFPNMTVDTETQSAEGVEYPILVVSDGSSQMMTIEPTGDNALIYRVKVNDPQASGTSGHTPGTTFAEVYGGSIPDSCVSGIDEASGFVLCSAPSAQNVQYAFTGNWEFTFDQLPDEAALNSGVLQHIVWLPGNF